MVGGIVSMVVFWVVGVGLLILAVIGTEWSITQQLTCKYRSERRSVVMVVFLKKSIVAFGLSWKAYPSVITAVCLVGFFTLSVVYSGRNVFPTKHENMVERAISLLSSM